MKYACVAYVAVFETFRFSRLSVLTAGNLQSSATKSLRRFIGR